MIPGRERGGAIKTMVLCYIVSSNYVCALSTLLIRYKIFGPADRTSVGVSGEGYNGV